MSANATTGAASSCVRASVPALSRRATQLFRPKAEHRRGTEYGRARRMLAGEPKKEVGTWQAR